MKNTLRTYAHEAWRSHVAATRSGRRGEIFAQATMFGWGSRRPHSSRRPKGVPVPAVTVPDVLTLPAIRHLDAASTDDRPVVSITTAPGGYEGLGFPVRRAFAGVDSRLLDPFVHMDQMGEVEYAPGEPKGTDWH